MVPALSRRLARAWPDLLAVAVVIAFGLWRYRAVLGCEHACLQDYGKDLPYEFYTVHLFARQAFDQGSFPFWDPHIMAGHPVGAHFGNSLLYPPLLIWVLLSGAGPFTPRAEELLLVLHLVATGATVHIAARMLRFGRLGALVAGILAVGMPQGFPMMQWPPMVFGIPWVPLVLASWIRLAEAPRVTEERGSLWVLSVCGALLLCAAHPNLPAYTWLSMALVGAMVLLRDLVARRRGPGELLRHATLLALAATLPVVLAAPFVIPLLRDLPLLARYVLPFHPSMGYLEPVFAWNLLFPGSSELPLMSFGPLATGLALGAALFLSRRGSLGWTLPVLAGFWLVYMPEGSPLFEALRPVPLMGTMRYATRAVVVLALLLALVGGEAAGALMAREARGPSLRPSWGWLLPASFAATVAWAWKAGPISAEALARAGGHGPWLLGLGLLAVPALLLLARGPRRRQAAGGLVALLAVGAFLELDRWAPLDFAVPEAGPMEPHASMVAKARERFPQVYASAGLERHLDWGHHNVVPYLTGTQAVSGLTWPWFRTAYTASPANYYFLFSDDWPGTKQSLYTKRSPSLDAGLWDLLGVRWFMFQERREWVYLSRQPDYYDRVQDEWIELALPEPRALGVLRAQLACDFTEPTQGRVHLERDGVKLGQPLDARPGEPLTWILDDQPQRALRLVLERRGMNAGADGPRDLALGCRVSELRLSDGGGHPVPAADLQLRASSGTPDQQALWDDEPATGWRPDLGPQLDALLTRGRVAKRGEGLYENLDVLPRAFLVYHWGVSDDPEASWALLRSDDFDPRGSAWFEEDPGLPAPPAQAGEGAVEITRYEPNLIELSARSDQPALLLLGELASPGWKAWVDGERVPVLTADGAFRAIWHEPGEHRVRLRYRPPGFGWGLLLAAMGLLALALLTRGRQDASPAAAEDAL